MILNIFFRFGNFIFSLYFSGTSEIGCCTKKLLRVVHGIYCKPAYVHVRGRSPRSWVGRSGTLPSLRTFAQLDAGRRPWVRFGEALLLSTLMSAATMGNFYSLIYAYNKIGKKISCLSQRCFILICKSVNNWTAKYLFIGLLGNFISVPCWFIYGVIHDFKQNFTDSALPLSRPLPFSERRLILTLTFSVHRSTCSTSLDKQWRGGHQIATFFTRTVSFLRIPPPFHTRGLFVFVFCFYKNRVEARWEIAVLEVIKLN